MSLKISLLSKWLVGLQMLLITLILATGKWIPTSWPLLIVFASGWAIALLALLAFRQTVFTVFPEPKQQAQLVSHGIYGFIRHPFYTALLLITGALVGQTISWWRLSFFLILLAVLLIKINHEEKLLETKFSEYKTYMLKTKKLIPFVW